MPASVATTQPSVTLTTIILSSVKPDYDKLPTLKPVGVSETHEKITTSTTAAPSIMDTNSNTITYNRTTSKPSSTQSSSSVQPTTINKIGKFTSLTL